MLFRFAASFYQYFLYKKLDGPYFRTLVLLSFSVFMHIAEIGIAFHIPTDTLFFWGPIKYRFLQKIFAGVYFLVIGLLLSLVFSKSRLAAITFTEAQTKKWRLIIAWYVIINFILLFTLIFTSGVDSGLIRI